MTPDGDEDRYFSYERLDVYRVACDLTARVRAVASRLPPAEIDLRKQWLRACTSLKSNTAEAAQETRPAEKARIFRIARREVGEVHSCTRDAQLAGYLAEEELAELTILANRISAMLYRLIERFDR